MAISAILSSGLQAMQSSINRTDAAGSRIAGSGLNTDNSADEVQLMQGANDAKVAANVIKTGDEVLGTLIDMMA